VVLAYDESPSTIAMRTIPDRHTVQRVFDEACGNFELGLLEEALEQLFHYEEIAGPDMRSLELKKAIANAQGKYSEFARLSRENFRNSVNPLNDLHAVNTAGDPGWAYAKCLEVRDYGDQPLYWLNRACFASQIGNFRDATSSLLECFIMSRRYRGDAFMDPDLESLWPWMKNAPLDLSLAEQLANPVWSLAIMHGGAGERPVTITDRMRSSVPEVFQQYIPKYSFLNGLSAYPSMPRDVHGRYLSWQINIVLPRMEMLLAASKRSSAYLREQQLPFALWQARNGNPTASRDHVLFYLQHYPKKLSRLNILREHGMGYFLEDIAPAIEEEEDFAKNLVWVANFGTTRPAFGRETLDEVGPVGSRSTVFKLRLASLEIHDGRIENGIRLLANVIEAWPHDAEAYLKLTEAFIRQGRWEEARLSFAASPSHARHFWRFRDQWHQIKEEDPEAKEDRKQMHPVFFGQRDLGYRLVGRNLPTKNILTTPSGRRLDDFHAEP
jgi:tetratricopeptide (TPR) repeat protein